MREQIHSQNWWFQLNRHFAYIACIRQTARICLVVSLLNVRTGDWWASSIGRVQYTRCDALNPHTRSKYVHKNMCMWGGLLYYIYYNQYRTARNSRARSLAIVRLIAECRARRARAAAVRQHREVRLVSAWHTSVFAHCPIGVWTVQVHYRYTHIYTIYVNAVAGSFNRHSIFATREIVTITMRAIITPKLDIKW